MRGYSSIAISLLLSLLLATPVVAQYGTGIAHFVLTDDAGHIDHVTPNQLWQDLTYNLGAPPVLQTSVGWPATGFADGVGDHIFYVGATDGHVYQIFYCGKNCVPLDTWVLQDITQIANNAPLPKTGSPLNSFVSPGQEHVLYLGANEHVYQLVQTSNGGWTYQDLTAAASCVVAASNSPIGSFNDSLGQHVFHFGGSYHVRQLYYAYSSGTWVCQDLTASAPGAPVAVSGSALAAFTDAQEHAVYQAANNGIYQLITHTGGWGYQQLPTPGASTAVQGTPIAVTADLSHGYEYVFYSAQGQVGNYPTYGLIYNKSTWIAHALGFGSETGIPFTTNWASQTGALVFVAESEFYTPNFSINVNGGATFNDDFGEAPRGVVPGATLQMWIDP